MGSRESFGVAFQLVDVEQFGPQRRFFPARGSVGVIGWVPGDQTLQFFRNEIDIRQDLSGR
jgi:hypothetical protein